MLGLLKLCHSGAQVPFKITFASHAYPSENKKKPKPKHFMLLSPHTWYISVLQSQTQLSHDAQGWTCFKHMFDMVQSITVQLVTLVAGVQWQCPPRLVQCRDKCVSQVTGGTLSTSCLTILPRSVLSQGNTCLLLPGCLITVHKIPNQSNWHLKAPPCAAGSSRCKWATDAGNRMTLIEISPQKWWHLVTSKHNLMKKTI